MQQRNDGRANNELRTIKIERSYTRYAEGSVLVSAGNTKVLCNVSVQDSVPKFLAGKKQGWLTAEYSMLPRATHSRSQRDGQRNRINARAQEIQRLIGRSLRSALNLNAMPDLSFVVDCDVIQADGGTRTAAINGAMVAVHDAVQHCLRNSLVKQNPIIQPIAAISVGLINGNACLDLNYAEDSTAQTDMNVVMDNQNNFVEIQGTAESQNFSTAQLTAMLELAQEGIRQIVAKQTAALS